MFHKLGYWENEKKTHVFFQFDVDFVIVTLKSNSNSAKLNMEKFGSDKNF